jgi:hypothetical protein
MKISLLIITILFFSQLLSSSEINDFNNEIKNQILYYIDKNDPNNIIKNELYKMYFVDQFIITFKIDSSNFIINTSGPIPINIQNYKIKKVNNKYFITGSKIDETTGKIEKNISTIILEFNKPFGKIIDSDDITYFYYINTNNFEKKVKNSIIEYFYNKYKDYKQDKFKWNLNQFSYNNSTYNNYIIYHVKNIQNHKRLDEKYFVIFINDNNYFIIEINNQILNVIDTKKIFYTYGNYYFDNE